MGGIYLGLWEGGGEGGPHPTPEAQAPWLYGFRICLRFYRETSSLAKTPSDPVPRRRLRPYKNLV